LPRKFEGAVERCLERKFERDLERKFGVVGAAPGRELENVHRC
jgi:hypothetical protein